LKRKRRNFLLSLIWIHRWGLKHFLGMIKFWNFLQKLSILYGCRLMKSFFDTEKWEWMEKFGRGRKEHRILLSASSCPASFYFGVFFISVPDATWTLNLWCIELLTILSCSVFSFIVCGLTGCYVSLDHFPCLRLPLALHGAKRGSISNFTLWILKIFCNSLKLFRITNSNELLLGCKITSWVIVANFKEFHIRICNAIR